MDVLKKNKVTAAGRRPLGAAASVPTPEKASSADLPDEAPGAVDPASAPCGEARATVHPQEDGTCVIEVTCSCGNVIQIQCITQ
jgi:hypothetical protein